MFIIGTDSSVSRDILILVNVDGTNLQEALRFEDEASIDSVAVDPHEKKLFVTDQGLRRILSISYDMLSQLVINVLAFDPVIPIEEPLDIEVDIETQKIYWIDRSLRHIVRANYDGSDAEIIVMNIASEGRGIALDVNENKLFWIDGNDIKVSDLDGNNVEVLTQIPPTTATFDIELADEFLFVSTESGMIRLDKNGSSQVAFGEELTGGFIAALCT